MASEKRSDQLAVPEPENLKDFAFIPAPVAAKPPADFERRAGIAPQQSLLIAEPHSDLSTFQNSGVAGPSSTPVSDFRHALGAKYCPSGM